MSDISEAITGDTLLIYDLDNTVYEPVGNYGSDQWFFYLNSVYQRNGFSAEDSEEKALELWNRTQYLIKVKPVESSTPQLIREQQSQGIKVIAMTARTQETADITLGQLRSIGVSFEHSSIYDNTLQIKQNSNDWLRSDVMLHRGVLFVGEKNAKGAVLLLMLEKLKYRPKNVVFVDDRLRHIIGVETALESIGVPYKGFRYGGADAKVKAFVEFTSEITDRETAETFYMGRPTWQMENETGRSPPSASL